MATEPTILVKKADGSLVRLPLSEVKKLQRPAGPVLRTVVARSAPDDFSEPFAELDSAIDKNSPPASQSRDEDIVAVLMRLKFRVAPELQIRLKNLIQSRLKDVKSAEQVRALAARSISDGGLALSAEAAAELVKVCALVSERTWLREQRRDAAAAPLKPPALGRGAIPAVAGRADLIKYRQSLPAVLPVPAPVVQSEQFFLSAASSPRAAVYDVAPPPLQLGPLEELKALTVLDFRRLSKNSAEATARLEQKMRLLANESVILFWQALAVWRTSPLFSSYLRQLGKSLTTGLPLGSDVSALGQLNRVEALAIGGLMERLRV